MNEKFEQDVAALTEAFAPFAAPRNVLVDRHHAGLYHSLQLLGRRLGWMLWTPTGHAWWDEWYWSFGRSTYSDDRLAQQYLNLSGPDPEYPEWPIHYVTLDEARGMTWDYVVATLQDNQMGFSKFAREAGATLVFQVGNTGQQIDWTRSPLVLNSSEMPLFGKGIQYHQEFDSDGLFGFREPTGSRQVRSFVHLLDQTVCFPLWQEFRTHWPDAIRHGHAPVEPDESWQGNVKPLSAIADRMEHAGWGWHDKPHGDGFGHVIFGWAAIGRPLIGHASHYRGKMAEIFWTPETSIDLDRVSVQEAAEIVRTITPAEHREMCLAIRAIFDAEVDYDREEQAIRELLGMPVAVAA